MTNIKLLIQHIILVSCLLTTGILVSAQADAFDTKVSDKSHLVSAQWLADHINDKNLIILDTSVIVKMDEKGGIESISGRSIYEQGHIPNAQYADLIEHLSDTKSSMTFVMPTAEQFQIEMGKLGVGKDTKVILYSANHHAWPTRLWWMLRWAGFDNAAILDGGLTAWKANGGAISTEAVQAITKDFPLNVRPHLIADQQEVRKAIKDSNTFLIDSLSEGHYTGKFSLYQRPGHIPSATNMSSSTLINETGHYKSFDELDMMHEGNRTKRSITYCGGGVAATSVAFTMLRLGYTDVAVYMGSLQEWTADPENPMTVD